MLTTSHKSSFSIEAWKDLFKKRGLCVEKIKSLPDNVHNLSRKDEIVNWFAVNNFSDDFIIIDDDRSLNDLPDMLKRHLVQTSPYIGLTEELLQDVKSKPGNSPQVY